MMIINLAFESKVQFLNYFLSMKTFILKPVKKPTGEKGKALMASPIARTSEHSHQTNDNEDSDDDDDNEDEDDDDDDDDDDEDDPAMASSLLLNSWSNHTLSVDTTSNTHGSASTTATATTDGGGHQFASMQQIAVSLPLPSSSSSTTSLSTAVVRKQQQKQHKQRNEAATNNATTSMLAHATSMLTINKSDEPTVTPKRVASPPPSVSPLSVSSAATSTSDTTATTAAATGAVKARTRRFSWEAMNVEDTAEYLATLLIKRALSARRWLRRRQASRSSSFSTSESDNDTPTLNNFEFFIQLVEYLDHMQLQHVWLLAKSQESANASTSKRSSSNASAATLASTLASSSSLASWAQWLNFGGGSRRLNAQSHFATSIKLKSAALAAVALANHDLLRAATSNSSTLTASLPSSSSSSSWRLTSTSALSMSMSLTGRDSLALAAATVAGRIIGDDVWAPVREQLILNTTSYNGSGGDNPLLSSSSSDLFASLNGGSSSSSSSSGGGGGGGGGGNKSVSRLEQIKQQHFRCADCGIQFVPDKLKTLYYCEYFGKYFCRCCHISEQSYIPAYVVASLDFSKWAVSKKAKSFLDKIYSEPLITLESLNPALFAAQSSPFARIKMLRAKLHNCRSYIRSCRFAVALNEKLYANFDDFFVNDQHVYSIEIIYKIKRTKYYEKLRDCVDAIVEHITRCELCSQQGHICGLCTNRELLYPFQIERVAKCPNCLSCYHRTCFRMPEQCPRCERLRARTTQSTSTNNIHDTVHNNNNNNNNNS